eukprot:m.152184 g.152184  ORF g.152184 m.152184 type:complete len:440 (+) comp30795_c5_seq1:77-1396(+)
MVHARLQAVLVLLLGCCEIVQTCSPSLAIFACTKCVYVDSAIGDDSKGDGSEGSPFKTISKAQDINGDFDGAVLKGTFEANNGFTFRESWSYTGYGLGTEIDFNSNGKGSIVNGNDFHRMVLDFNQDTESATFRGGPLGLYNAVLRDQHTTDGGRELLFDTSTLSYLTIKNCLMLDVEYNIWIINRRGNIDIQNTVSAKCDSRFGLLSSAPSVSIDPETYKIISGGKYTDANGYGVWGGDCKYSWFDLEGPTTTATSTTQTVTTDTNVGDLRRQISELVKTQELHAGVLTTLFEQLQTLQTENHGLRLTQLEETSGSHASGLAGLELWREDQSVRLETLEVTLASSLATLKSGVRSDIVSALSAAPALADLDLESAPTCVRSSTNRCVPEIDAVGDVLKLVSPSSSVKIVTGDCGIIDPCELHAVVRKIATAIDTLKQL